MPFSPPILKALEGFRRSESPTARGPRFEEVAVAFEQEMHQPGVLESAIHEAFGPPDIQRPGLSVYFFDHTKAGRNCDEWYFIFQDGKLVNSGFNRRGINDFTSGDIG